MGLVDASHRPLAEGGELALHLTDPGAGLDATVTYVMEPSGMLGVRARLTRRADADPAPYDLTQVTTLLPLGAEG